ncbi:MAG: hypothetical protein DHS20C14_10100 [Phycisphaeraceae bacterium]|nr:MAG: hypothetical protein DHS20C14_10100 [Phycisphaeraceae bacterium]
MSLAADRTQWAAYLRAISQPALAGTPPVGGASEPETRAWVDGFRDELGHRRTVDGALLARVCRIDQSPPPERLAPEDRLWWGAPVESIEDMLVDDSEGGPLLMSSRSGGAIETMTEGELMALHALWARREARPDGRTRCLAAARWHVAELQPDNATGVPWAVHVFVEMALAAGDEGERSAALFHAEGLVHAACVTLGRPGIRAACILLDAARELEARPA